MFRRLKLRADITVAESSQAMFSIHDCLEYFDVVMSQWIEAGAAAAGSVFLARGDAIQIPFGVRGIVDHCQRVQVTTVGFQGDLAIA